jgi:MinD-like ATPase involved in chromosome partitioning or flagellar assembly
MADIPIWDWHRISIELLMTDADLALQSISSLFATDDKETVARVIRNSREVYDSIQAKRREVVLSPQETATLDDKMDRLRARLKFLGEQV